jgi:phosphoserine phosphatase
MNITEMLKAEARRMYAKKVGHKSGVKAKTEQALRGESDEWAAKRARKLARRKLG